MKEHPILFSAPMVRAILDGRKTQTRRLLKPQPIEHREVKWLVHPNDIATKVSSASVRVRDRASFVEDEAKIKVGDRFLVREAYFRFGHWEPVTGPYAKTQHGRQRWRFVPDSAEALFEAPNEFRKGMHHTDPSTPAWHKRLTRFMPHAFSRITLEVTAVRVQRLQEISEEDAKAEGCDGNCPIGYIPAHQAGPCVYQFAQLWDSINGKTAPWASNPWVWCYSFNRLK